MTNKTVLVSVIMPTYNCGKYIAESIESVIHQTISDWEIEIVDDCSSDNTYDVLKPYLKEYENIHYYKLEKNSGPAVARSEAIRRARGKYCAFLDSDDLWLPNKLEKQIRFMEDNDIDFSCTGYYRIKENGDNLNIALFPPRKTNYRKCIFLGNPIGNLTVIYNQEILGKFEVPNIRKRNDFALWLKILKKTKYCYGLEDVLAKYRTGRSESVSANKIKQIRYHWHLYRNIEKHCIIRSAYEVLCWIFVKVTGIGVDKRSI